MGWKINELDKSKVEQSIANEYIRIEQCEETLDKLKKEYEAKEYEYMMKLSKLKDKIMTVESSIVNGKKFIEECENHHLNLIYENI